MEPTLPDKNEGVQCPYDPSHFVERFRLNTHIPKCKQSHPNPNLVSCYYNVVHVVHVSELQDHHETCPDRYNLEMPPSEEERAVAKRYPVCNIEVNEEESWDNYYVPKYDPQQHCKQNDIVMRLDVAPPSIKKQFRQSERQKMHELERQHSDSRASIRSSSSRSTSRSSSRSATEAMETQPSCENQPSTNTNWFIMEDMETEPSFVRPADENHPLTSTSRPARYAAETQPSIVPAGENQSSTSTSKPRPLTINPAHQMVITGIEVPRTPWRAPNRIQDKSSFAKPNPDWVIMGSMRTSAQEIDDGFTLVQRKGRKRKGLNPMMG